MIARMSRDKPDVNSPEESSSVKRRSYIKYHSNLNLVRDLLIPLSVFESTPSSPIYERLVDD
jgi:hypothetical protein